MFAAAVIDFFDGFAARMLKAYSAIGKDLDSLADMVTFGLVPGLMMYQICQNFNFPEFKNGCIFAPDMDAKFAYAGLLIPVFSALRLAKFNNDVRQTESFIGLPTPANAMLIASIPLIIDPWFSGVTSPGIIEFIISVFLSPWLFIAFCCIMSFLMIAELPLFSLKFKKFGFKGNEIRYVMIASAVILLGLLKFAAIPFIIFLYLVLAIINNRLKKTK